MTQKLNCASGKLGDAWIRWLEKYCALHADYLTAPSRAMSEIVAKEYSLEKGTIRVIANPLDTTLFTPGVNKQEELIVLYTGRLERRKGVHILAKAIPLVLSHIPHAIFVFIGKDTNSSPCNLSMKDYIREQSVGGKNVVFMEHM